MPRRPRRAAVAGALCLALLVAAPVDAATEATSSADAERILVDLVNQRRAEVGAPPLTPRADLHRISRDWSFTQAERGELAHNPSLSSRACCWTRIAENVARGSVDSAGASTLARRIYELWRNSGSHDATMTDTGVDQLGVGIVLDDDGTVWGTAAFRMCDGTDCVGGGQGPAGDSSVNWAPPPPPPSPSPTPAPPPPSPAPAPPPSPSPSPDPPPPPSPSPSPTPTPSPTPSPSPSPSPAPSPTPDPTPSPAPVAPDAGTRRPLLTTAVAPPNSREVGLDRLIVPMGAALTVTAALVATFRRRD